MGLILILVGVIIQRALAKSDRDSEDFFENASMFMINPYVRLVLTILSWILIIKGIFVMFS